VALAMEAPICSVLLPHSLKEVSLATISVSPCLSHQGQGGRSITPPPHGAVTVFMTMSMAADRRQGQAEATKGSLRRRRRSCWWPCRRLAVVATVAVAASVLVAAAEAVDPATSCAARAVAAAP